jgi:hypothetical protein
MDVGRPWSAVELLMRLVGTQDAARMPALVDALERACPPTIRLSLARGGFAAMAMIIPLRTDSTRAAVADRLFRSREGALLARAHDPSALLATLPAPAGFWAWESLLLSHSFRAPLPPSASLAPLAMPTTTAAVLQSVVALAKLSDDAKPSAPSRSQFSPPTLPSAPSQSPAALPTSILAMADLWREQAFSSTTPSSSPPSPPPPASSPPSHQPSSSSSLDLLVDKAHAELATARAIARDQGKLLLTARTTQNDD